MSDAKNSSEPKSSQGDPDQLLVQGDVFSLDDLDELLAADDPEFMASMNQIEQDASLANANVEPIDLAAQELPDGEENGDLKPSRWALLRMRLRLLLIAFYRGLWKLAGAVKGLALDTVIFIRTGLPERLRYWRSRMKKNLGTVANWFWSLERWQKLSVLIGVGMFFAAAVALWVGLQHGRLPLFYEPLLSSWEDVADSVHEYRQGDPAAETPYELAFPEQRVFVRLRQILVNLTPSSSSRHPMGSFRFTLQTSTPGAAIELRAREQFYLDVIQRTVEGYTFEDLSQESGKSRLKARLIDELNQILVSGGQVRDVFIDQIVIKP